MYLHILRAGERQYVAIPARRCGQPDTFVFRARVSQLLSAYVVRHYGQAWRYKFQTAGGTFRVSLCNRTAAMAPLFADSCCARRLGISRDPPTLFMGDVPYQLNDVFHEFRKVKSKLKVS